MSSNDVDYFCGNRFLAHFWAILEPRYDHLKAFLGPKMTKTRLKQPKMTPNHPKNGQKWCRNIFGKIDFWSFWGHFGVILVILGSFWGHFGSFWVILGHFGPFWGSWSFLGSCWAPTSPTIAHKSLKWPPKWPHCPKNGSIHAIMGPKKRLKNVFRGQNNGQKRIFRPWSPYKCC